MKLTERRQVVGILSSRPDFQIVGPGPGKLQNWLPRISPVEPVRFSGFRPVLPRDGFPERIEAHGESSRPEQVFGVPGDGV